jgi:hypothetical protein
MALKRVRMQNAAAATGNGETVAVAGKAGVLLEVSGTYAAVITVEGSVQEDWFAVDSYAMNGGNRSTTITNTEGLYWVPAPGLQSVRARISAYTSGSVTVWGGATDVPYGIVPS